MYSQKIKGPSCKALGTLRGTFTLFQWKNKTSNDALCFLLRKKVQNGTMYSKSMKHPKLIMKLNTKVKINILVYRHIYSKLSGFTYPIIRKPNKWKACNDTLLIKIMNNS